MTKFLCTLGALAAALAVAIVINTVGQVAQATTTTADAADCSATTLIQHGGGVANIKTFSIEIPSTLTAGDVFQLACVPAGATVLDVNVAQPDVDSGSGITLDLGYGTDPDYFAAASTTGRTGGVIRPSAATAGPLTLSAKDTIDLTVNAAPSTGVAGTAYGYVIYTTP